MEKVVKENNYKYKYVHFLWANEFKFIMPLVKMFNNKENGFNLDEHLFVTTKQQVYDEMKIYQNIVLEKGSASAIINKYGSCSKWMFSHGFPSNIELLKIKRKYLKIFICRTWGGSRNKSKWSFRRPINSMKNYVLDRAYFLFYRYTLGCSKAVGIGNIVDELDLSEWHWADKTKLIRIDYPRENVDEILAKAREKKANNNVIKVLVGHQGCPGEKHVSIVKKLLRYNADFEIFVPLSYGNKLYIDKVIKELSEIKDQRIKIVTDFMPINDYLVFLASVDVAIMDEPSSMALGNIAYLLYFRKKIVLNKDGIIRKAFDVDGLPYVTSDKLDCISFSELSRPVYYNEPLTTDMLIKSYSEGVQQWKDAYAFLG